MTRKEWIEKNLPAYINENADGGVIGCPTSYNELVRIDPGVLTNKPCKGCHEMTPFVCELCWNMKLNLKEERKETMTRREFVLRNYGKNFVNDTIPEGIRGCPGSYEDLVALDPSCNALRIGQPSCKDNGLTCTECWNQELNAKEERKKNMTRKEWMLKNHPDVVGASFKGGVLGCPGSHRDLVDIDPSAANLESSGCSMYPDCTTCWNAPLPQQSNDEIPMPIIGGRFWTFVRVNFSLNTDLLVVGNFVIVALMRANAEIRVVAKDETLNLEYIFFYDPEKKSIRKLPKDWALEKKYPEIDFTIYWDEESMNRAKRGIVTDREYTNQYILLTKAENKKGE